jgi:ferrous iron transport protein A
MPATCCPPPVDRAPAPLCHAIPLTRLRPGQSGIVRRIRGRPEDVHRLEEFGLRDGVAVEMFRPGATCILRLKGGKICLRANEALEILVVPTAEVS